MSKFWEDYPQIMEELETINRLMKKQIQTREKHIEESILPMVEGGGKMLRPAFLLLAAKFGNYHPEKMHNLAAVVEMLHLATLVHDDIIDKAKLRRGCETIQSKYGKEYAVYIGDFLFCQCLMMLSEYDYTMENMRDLSKAIARICMGEIKQYSLRYAQNINLRNYIRIISGKTAALFAMSFYVGAREAQCDEKLARLLGRIGYNVGMAFQIIDDLLDYRGDTALLGKSAQKDLKRGYYTLPLIYALEKDKEGEISKILASCSFSNREIEKIIQLVHKYGGLTRAQRVADRYTFKAYANIEKLPDCESKEVLKAVMPKLLERSY